MATSSSSKQNSVCKVCFTVKQTLHRPTFQNGYAFFAFGAFGGTIASFADLATRNFTTFFAAILIAAPEADHFKGVSTLH
jgi:hypothetical protein